MKLLKIFGHNELSNEERNAKFLKPDFIDERDDRYLLIWGSIPFWTVVDKEFYEFLNSFDGNKSIDEAINLKNEWKSNKKYIQKSIKILEKQGIIFYKQTSEVFEAIDKVNEFVPIENVAINITNKCNLNCPICYNYDNEYNSGIVELSDSEIICALEQIKPFITKEATLTVLGGEPLLFEKKLLSISRVAVDMGLTVIISTNGLNVSEEFARVAAKLKLEVQVSIDGHNPETNDRIRGKGSFDKAIEGVRKLVQNKAHTILSYVCCEENYIFLKEFYELADFLGVNEARFIPLKLVGGGKTCSFKTVNMKELILFADRLFSENEKFRKFLGRDFYSILATTCSCSLKRSSCGTGIQTVLIDSDGTLYPCVNMVRKEFAIANIRDKDYNFENIWLRSEFINKFRKLTNIDKMNKNCSVCFVSYWCLGCCRGETYSVKMDLRAPFHSCSDIRQAIIEMLWILSRGRANGAKYKNVRC